MFNLTGLKDSKKSISVYTTSETRLLNFRNITKSYLEEATTIWQQIRKYFRVGFAVLCSLFYTVAIEEKNYIAYDGDVVTILGNIKYNPQQDTLVFDSPDLIFFGGK